ncbi:uncharacterized protein LOC100181400 [Ciona intestinalis]
MEVTTPVLVGLLIGSIVLAFVLSACSAKVFARGKKNTNTPGSAESTRKSLHNLENGQYISPRPRSNTHLPTTRYFNGNTASIMAARQNLQRIHFVPVKTGYMPKVWQPLHRSQIERTSPVSTISGNHTSISSRIDLSSNATSRGSLSSREYPPSWMPKNTKNMPPSGVNFYANVPPARGRDA